MLQQYSIVVYLIGMKCDLSEAILAMPDLGQFVSLARWRLALCGVLPCSEGSTTAASNT